MCDGPLTDVEVQLVLAEASVLEWKELFLDLLCIHNELLAEIENSPEAIEEQVQLCKCNTIH